MSAKKPYDLDSPFIQELQAEAEALERGEQIMTVNGSPMGQAIWNLIVSKRDLTMYCNHGVIPTRGWKVTNVKKYFGIKGTGKNLLERFMVLFNDIMDEGGDEQ